METSPDRTSRRSGHARSGPLLRTRDVEAATWPSALYLLVSLETPELRAWRIVGGERFEVPLEVIAG